MKIVVACGGTGGHAFPGLAVAQELLARGHDVTVWDSGRDVESSVMRTWRGSVFSTGARQISASTIFALVRSLFRCWREIKRSRPDVMLAMGSYSSLAPVLVAHWNSVPVVLHEANAVPGRAIELLARFAKCVAVSFEAAKRCLGNVATVNTGLPVRDTIAKGSRFSFIPKNAFVVFVTGGSQGAVAVNELASEALVEVKKELDSRGPDARPLYVIHQTGRRDEGRVIARYMLESIPSRVKAFEDCMADAFASADIVIARSGASTCFELASCGKPAFFVPLPTALRNHQHFNAEAFVKNGAADEGAQSRLTSQQLARYIISKYDNPQRLECMSKKMKEMAVPSAAANVADLVEGKGVLKLLSRAGAPVVSLMAALIVPSVLRAAALSVGNLPASPFLDSEVSTNISFNAFRSDAKRMSLLTKIDCSVSNCVQIAMGRDENSDGVLSFSETEAMYGWRAGSYFVENVRGGRRYERKFDAADRAQTMACEFKMRYDSSLESFMATAGGIDLFPELSANTPSWLYSRQWNVMRVTRRGSAAGTGWFHCNIDYRQTEISVR